MLFIFFTAITDSLLPASNTEANWEQDESHSIASAPGVPNNEQVRISSIVDIRCIYKILKCCIVSHFMDLLSLSTQISSVPSLSVFPDAMVPPLATEGEESRVSTSSPLINTTIPPSQQQTAVLDNRFVLFILLIP